MNVKKSLNDLLTQSAEMWNSLADLYESEGFKQDAAECRELAASRLARLED